MYENININTGEKGWGGGELNPFNTPTLECKRNSLRSRTFVTRRRTFVPENYSNDTINFMSFSINPLLVLIFF